MYLQIAVYRFTAYLSTIINIRDAENGTESRQKLIFMFHNAALDIVIGLVFIYLLYSLLGTLLQEIIATNIGLRGFILKMAIRRMLDDEPSSGNKRPAADKLSTAFYEHPLVKYLANGSWPRFNKKPSYISKETFSKVVIDLLRGQDVKPGDSSRSFIESSLYDKDPKIKWAADTPIEGETLSYLRSMWVDAQGDVARFKECLEQWFLEMMDRTTGWYKKYTQRILLLTGFIIALAFNVDTIKIVATLRNNPEIRNQVITQANDFSKAHPNLEKELDSTKWQIRSMILPKGISADSLNRRAEIQYIKAGGLKDSLFNQALALTTQDIKKVNNFLAAGWNGGFLSRKDCDPESIAGWLLTALAISLGAPFWFDLLNKLMKLRSSIAAGNEKNDRSSGTPKKTERVG